MAVESTLSHAVYNGTGFAAVGYSIPFDYTDPDHIQVSIQAEDDTEPTVLSASQYNIQADPAVVYTLAAYPSTTKVTLERVIPYTQPTVWPEGGRFLAQTHEAAADRAVMQIQQLSRDVGQTIRLPLSSGAPAALKPTPGGLMGFDENGEYVHYDSTRVRELAQLEGGTTTNPLATWADATERAARVPDLAGQIGLQRNDGTVWRALSTNVGDWALAVTDTGTVRYVRTEAQFAAAVAAGGIARIVGTVNLTASYANTVPLIIEGDVDAKITFTASYLFNPAATLIIRNLTFEGADRISQRCVAIGGSRFVGLFMAQHVTFKTIGNAIAADGGPTSNIMPDIVVDHCTFNQIGASGYTGGGSPGNGGDGAVAILWNLGKVIITNNKFTDIWFNAIWVGQNGFKTGDNDNSSKVATEDAIGRVWIAHNWIRDCERIPIESFHCDYAVIAFNQIIESGNSEVYGDGCGIALSSTGKYAQVIGNYVKNYSGYGIEIIGDYSIVMGNTVDTCTKDRSNMLVSMSLNTANHSLVSGNHFIDIVNKTYAHAAIDITNSTDVTVTGNKFTRVSIACQVQNTSCDRITFTNNEHYFSNGDSALGVENNCTFCATSGTKHVVLHNVTRNIGALDAGKFIKVANTCGGYFDYSTGQQIASGGGGTYLEVGDASDNLVIA